MNFAKATAINSDLFFFLWQIYSRNHVRIFEKNILIEQGKLEDGWNCSGFDDWAYKYNKTEIFRNLIENAIYFGLIDEVIISIRELGKNKTGYTEIVEIERFEVNIKFLEDFRRGFPHRHDRNDNISSKFELFFNGFYSLPNNNYAFYFSYKVNHKNINSFIEEYLIDWFKDRLKKPRNYIKPSIQVDTFLDIISNCNSIYGNDFEYLLGTNTDLDEATLVIYFQALGWLSIKEYDDGISPIMPVTGKERKKFYLHIEQDYFEYIRRKEEFHKNSEDKNIMITEVGVDYFISYKSNNRIEVTGFGLKVISKLYETNLNSILLSKSTYSQTQSAFNRALVRVRERLREGGLRLEKGERKGNLYILSKIENI